MARSDDLSLLLAPKQAKTLGFQQGTVTAWNPVTYANTIDVNGTALTNLPVLTSSDAALIAVGDVVSILTFGSSWAILGRFTVPS